MLAVWLAISPFIFDHPADKPLWWWHDWIVALLIATLATISFVHQTRYAHFLEVLVAAWLIGFGWVSATGGLGAPAMQNWMCVGLLILMTAILPTDATSTPEAWRKWYREQGIEPPAA